MKRKHILVLATFIFLHSYSQKLSDIKKIPIEGFYSNPLISPSGEYLLLTSENFKGVHLWDFKKQKTIIISEAEGSGYGYKWSKTGEQFFFREKNEEEYMSESEVKSYTLKTKSLKETKIPHHYLPCFDGNFKDNNIVIFTNPNTLKIEAKDVTTSKTWIVTTTEGQFYHPTLSHDKKKIAVHNGPDIHIYHTDGSGLIANLGKGIATSWSEDDKYLIGFADESDDGHDIRDSNLYLYDVLNVKVIQLTTTADVFEMHPRFYDTNKIIYADGKTGAIYICKIK